MIHLFEGSPLRYWKIHNKMDPDAPLGFEPTIYDTRGAAEGNAPGDKFRFLTLAWNGFSYVL